MTSQGSPITRLRRALAGGDLLAARTAAAEVPHVDLDEAADLIMLIARDDPTKLDAAAVRFLGRACLERSFITLVDAQLLLACLGQLGRADAESARGLRHRTPAAAARPRSVSHRSNRTAPAIAPLR